MSGRARRSTWDACFPSCASTSTVSRASPSCPQALVEADDLSILGAPFYVMKRVSGIIVRRDLPPGLELGPEGVRALFDRVVEVHAELHAVDWRAAGLAGFGRPQGSVPP